MIIIITQRRLIDVQVCHFLLWMIGYSNPILVSYGVLYSNLAYNMH